METKIAIEMDEVEVLQIIDVLLIHQELMLKGIRIAEQESYFKDQERYRKNLQIIDNLLKLFPGGNVK